MCVSVLLAHIYVNVCVCMCLMCLSCGLEDQKAVSETLDLELQMVVSYHLGVGKQTQVLLKNKCS